MLDIMLSFSKPTLIDLHRDLSNVQVPPSIIDRLSQIVTANAVLRGSIVSNNESVLILRSQQMARRHQQQQQQHRQSHPPQSTTATSASSSANATDSYGQHLRLSNDACFSSSNSSAGGDLVGRHSHSAHGHLHHRQQSTPTRASSSSCTSPQVEHICHVCHAVLSSKFTLSQHLATHDTGPPKYICEICGRRYRHQRSVTEHKKTAHFRGQQHSSLGHT